MESKEAIIRLKYENFNFDTYNLHESIVNLKKNNMDKNINLVCGVEDPFIDKVDKVFSYKPNSGSCNYNFVFPVPLIVFSIEMLNQIGVNAIYDILKFSLMSAIDLVNKNKRVESYEIEATVIYVEKNSNCFRMMINYDLTDEQKDKLVDATIKKFLEL